MENSKSKRSVWMLIALFIGYTCVYVDKYTIGISLVTISKDLGFDPSQKGIILSMFFLGYAMFQIPMGYLNNKIGSKPVLVMSMILVGLFLIIFGFGFSLLFLVVVRFLTGSLAHSGYPPSVSNFISQNIPLEKRGFAQSAMLASSGFAAFIGPLLVSPLLTMVGWRKTYYIMGAFVILVGLFIYFVLPNPDKEEVQARKAKSALPFTEIIKDKLVWVLMISAFFMNAAIYGLTSWLASYLSEARGLPLDQVSYVSSLTGVFLLIAGVFGGYIIGRFFKGSEKRVIFITSILGAATVYGVYIFNNLTIAIVLLCLCNVLVILAFTTLMSLPHQMFNPDHIATKYATINAVGVFGGFFAPMIMGAIVSATGSYQGAFLFLAVTFILGGVIALFASKKFAKN